MGKTRKIESRRDKLAAEHNAKQAKLGEEKSQLLDGVKKEILTKIQIDLDELATFRRNYALVAKGKTGGAGVTDKPCPICGFKTSPLHDGRQHRSKQNKGAFKDDDLKRLGLTKV